VVHELVDAAGAAEQRREHRAGGRADDHLGVARVPVEGVGQRDSARSSNAAPSTPPPPSTSPREGRPSPYLRSFTVPISFGEGLLIQPAEDVDVGHSSRRSQFIPKKTPPL